MEAHRNAERTLRLYALSIPDFAVRRDHRMHTEWEDCPLV